MNEITGNKDFVLELLKDTARNLAVRHPSVQTKDMKQAFKETTDEQRAERDQIVERLQLAYERAHMQPIMPPVKKGAKKATQGVKKMAAAAAPVATVVQDVWYAPRDRTIALLQAAMDEHIGNQPIAEAVETKGIKKGAKGKAAPKKQKLTKQTAKSIFYLPKPAAKQGAAAGAKVFIGEQFDVLDSGWLEVAKEKLKLFFKGKHPFIRHQNLTDFRYAMNNQVKIALLADWGGGNEHAQNVANQVRACNPDIVIHLGDVYYAGVESEVRQRFLNFWPGVRGERGRSFALNSNHEMYSGGYAYFDITLKEFKQDASYFCLENDNWRLIGLDTGYVEHDLTQDQVEWLAALLTDGSNKKTVLLSHHQLYSAYEGSPAEIAGEKRLADWLKGFLNGGLIPFWFWGHEHLCVVYKKFQGVKGRCIGHGCFPYGVPQIPPPHGGPQVEQVVTRSDPKRPKRGIHGFALLTLSDRSMQVSYIDEVGNEDFTETL